MRKKVYVVGFGPGKRDYMTIEAASVIENADLIVGYTTYVNLLKGQFPEKEYLATPMKKEIERCKMAIEKSMEGKTVAMVSSGDSGIYGMAGVMMEVADIMNADVEIIPVAGVTAASAAAAILGAPLMHDFSIISLSDLMTPLEKIYTRVSCAAEGDFIICLYNPKSNKRIDYLANAAERIMEFRSENTPVGIVRNAGRDSMESWFTTLGELKNEPVDMFCVVIIGNSQTYIKNDKMITPRGYRMVKNEF